MKKCFAHLLLCCCMATHSFAQSIFWSDLSHFRVAPNARGPLYQAAQQYLDQIPEREYYLYMDIGGRYDRQPAPDTLQWPIYQGRRYSEYGPTIDNGYAYRQINELAAWFDVLEPRLYPSGEFVNATSPMKSEMQKIRKYKQSAAEHKQLSGCEVSAQWRNIGPFIRQSGAAATNTDASSSSFHKNNSPGIGRVNFIKKHPNNNDLYLGASNGGLWISHNGGQSWQVLNDQIAVLGTSDLVFDPNTPNDVLGNGQQEPRGC